MLRLALVVSSICYAIGVALIFTARTFIPICKGIGTAEAIYGPAITIASGWVIYAIVWKCLPDKKNRDTTTDSTLSTEGAPSVEK